MSDDRDGRMDRARGALLGLAVGDALGTTYEFEPIDQPPFPMLATRPAMNIVGGGPFGLEPGQVTDDTQLAVCLARSLAERRRFAIADVASRYVAWAEHAFDIGNQTRAAIDRLEEGDSPSSAGLGVWRDSDRRPAGNGSLMRTAPIGVAFALGVAGPAGPTGPAGPAGPAGDDALIDAAIAESMITHADPRCALACAAFDVAIAAAVTAPLDGPALVEQARRGLARGAARLRAAWAGEGDVAAADREHLARSADELASDLDAACADDPGVYRKGLHVYTTAGFVRVAFRIAFWHAVHTRSWRDALVDVASRGGDADTNAAIAGALLGARDGASAIPPAWIERVLAVTQPGPPEWAQAHHPRHLLALLA